LIKQGCKEFNNVKVMDGGDYIISNATFPTYFSRESENDIVTGQSCFRCQDIYSLYCPYLKNKPEIFGK